MLGIDLGEDEAGSGLEVSTDRSSRHQPLPTSRAPDARIPIDTTIQIVRATGAAPLGARGSVVMPLGSPSVLRQQREPGEERLRQVRAPGDPFGREDHQPLLAAVDEPGSEVAIVDAEHDDALQLEG
jgi:hypothetical protein